VGSSSSSSRRRAPVSVYASGGNGNEEKQKIERLMDKMKNAGWDPDLISAMLRTEAMIADISPDPAVTTFLNFFTTLTYLRGALFMGATYLSGSYTYNLDGDSNLGYILAACTGYFAVGILRSLWTLRNQSILGDEIRSLGEDAERVVRAAMQEITNDSKARQMEQDIKKVEWDPEGLLPPRNEKDGKPLISVADGLDDDQAHAATDEQNPSPGEEGLIAGMERKRARYAVDKFREIIVTKVRERSKEIPATGGALGALSSLDSMIQFDEDDGLSAETLGVSEPLFEAAEKIFKKFDDNADGVLKIPQLESLLAKYKIPCPGQREIDLFGKMVSRSVDEDHKGVSKADFLKFWADAERKSAAKESLDSDFPNGHVSDDDTVHQEVGADAALETVDDEVERR